ncbi:hypothetical protein XENOCAPTIV_023790, partial [Xenoophorus captivus]
GVTSPREDPIQCGEDLESLRRSYHLNGEEVQQVWMTVTGTDWHHVRGNWNPIHNNAVFAHNDQELTNRVRGLIDRLTVRYRCRADYAEIARLKQKEEEPFEEYRIRLTKVFKIHSGVQENEDEQGAY